jgi:hypothetical protein
MSLAHARCSCLLLLFFKAICMYLVSTAVVISRSLSLSIVFSSADVCAIRVRNADEPAVQHHALGARGQGQPGPVVQGRAGKAALQVNAIYSLQCMVYRQI